MPSQMSQANARQSKKNEGYFQRKRTDSVIEMNQMRKLLRHAARQGISYAPKANVGELAFMRIGNGYTQNYPEMEAAWKRCADVAGIGKARAVAAEFALRKGHWA